MASDTGWIPVDLDSYKATGWNEIDVLLITGDVYVDHPSFGVAIVARILESAGMKVMVISQPESPESLMALPQPKYFVGITSGNVDSMVANYTASGKPRKTDDYSFESKSGKRPNRAVIVYSNWVRQVFKGIPLIIGGLEASLRRFAHYDYWQNKVRHSILLDSKADLLYFGMAETALLKTAELLKRGVPFQNIRYLPGTAYITNSAEEFSEDSIELPSFETVNSDKEEYAKGFSTFYKTITSLDNHAIVQKDGNRFIVQNPPAPPLSTKEMDMVYGLPYKKAVHPNLRKKGPLKSLDSIATSIITHRGCYGECNFCAIALHQGRTIQSRSISSIVSEVEALTERDDFHGTISDLGGPTANMYGYDCEKKIKSGPCADKRCIFPTVCKALKPNHENYLRLLNTVAKIQGVKYIFISSGIRPDLIYADDKNGKHFMKQLVLKHTSGLLKAAPEHFSNDVLNRMGKNTKTDFERFFRDFYTICNDAGKTQHITAYLMVGHPGEGKKENVELSSEIRKFFKDHKQPIQIFTPTPSTLSTTMYYTELDPDTMKKINTVKKEKERTDFKKRALLELREDEKNGNNESIGKRETGKRLHTKGSPNSGRSQRRRGSRKG
ncbi:MAG TPA: YgiQ family radical SAM protein [Thermotogota bacterium]|nr:YgiQ family radical SAM protein [Thermotogota bacterium]HPJ89766.1 YgiQ family radical SAM protein [Thermotogota bacterium]HPR97011.1 YgiQ family radical SAM protein [Thermotogota bacterium]